MLVDSGEREDAGALDAAADDSSRDAEVDAAPPPIAEWPLYTIAIGAHAATVTAAPRGNPRQAFVSGLGARSYALAFDPSAAYQLTQPVEPSDQLDWNKLPGLSDCGTLDLSVDGVMFGWRWRTDVAPRVLEVTAYANNAGKHLTPPSPLFNLDADDLASASPVRYSLAMDGASYRFTVAGVVRGRAVDAMVTLPRRCADTLPSALTVQWAAGLYFGGTSTAPSAITARVFE